MNKNSIKNEWQKRFRLTMIKLPFAQAISHYRIDILIGVALAITIAIASYFSSQQIPNAIITDFYAQDVWFGSDIPTVFGNITSTKSDFGRNNKHPLFPLIAFPPIFLFSKILHLEPVSATRIVIALVAACWISLLFILFRSISCRRLDATLFSLLGGVSAASVFWLAVPESFSFGSVTILLGLIFVSLTQYRRFSPIWYVAVNVTTVSVTITNMMVGLLATIVNHRWKKVLQIICISLCVTTAIWILQRAIFRNAGFPFQPKTFIGEKKFMSGLVEHDSILSAFSSFVYQTIVMPAVRFSDSSLRPGWPKLDVNTLAPGSGGFWGTVAVFAWTVLLGLGVWGFFSTKQHPKLRIVLGLTILGQLFIHSIYGTQETFIYSLHFAPLLVTVAAFSTLTRMRAIGLILAGLLVISAGINNRFQFNQVTKALLDYGTPRQQVESQMRVRPSDPWSRSTSHVLLATPGSREEDKAYYEPGGSFSPIVGSFGVSIWIVDKEGNLKTTSDAIPLNQIQQQFTYSGGKNPPGIYAKTPEYQAFWSALKPGDWQLNLKVPASSNTRPVIAIRSVGPAGGAINSLHWDGQWLRINDRWSVKNLPKGAKVYLGSENTPGWIRQKSTVAQWQDEKGWGYARLELGQGDAWELVFEDSTPPPQPDLPVAGISSSLELDLPNSQFVDSFNAQIAHLMMGLVGDRTRPGDPLEYPQPRFRDGAYQMVALARSGQLEVAKQLSTYFAETDFLDGIQFKADVPALGIWALAAVATQLNQPEYDRWLWPHIRRKAELIVDMLSTNRPGYPMTSKVKLPLAENPDFLEMGLTAGTMGGSPGLISIDPSTNIMSYRALLDAADLGDRVNRSADAERWRSQAEQLKLAWQKTFEPQFSRMDATYTSGLWPSWIASTDRNTFVRGLQQRRDESHNAKSAFLQTPQNTYFDLAQTHQWLFLNERDRVWATLHWFWEHQASPGLYSWWGENNESKATPAPNSFSQWHWVRGWTNPLHVTPHYWTAAEMALLQLDMLAYVDRASSSPTLVIGAGIPEKWLSKPMSVKGLLVEGRLVNWSWDGKQINVQIKGKNMAIQLGSAFPANTPVNIVILPEQKPKS
jgi:hypothetical protein